MSFTSLGGWPDTWPIPEALLLHYLAHLKKKGLAPKTLDIHVSAIIFYGKTQGFSDPCQSFLAQQAMEGWKQLSPQPPDGQRPITLTMLRCLESSLPKVCSSTLEAVLFRAVFSLAFFGAFCCSELIVGLRSNSSGWLLAIIDVSIKGAELHFHVLRSKTDQHTGGGAHFTTLRPQGQYLSSPQHEGILVNEA